MLRTADTEVEPRVPGRGSVGGRCAGEIDGSPLWGCRRGGAPTSPRVAVLYPPPELCGVYDKGRGKEWTTFHLLVERENRESAKGMRGG